MTGQPGTDSAHQSPCSRCRAVSLVSMSSTRLEERPWRLVWACEFCGYVSVRAVPRALIGTLVEMFDRAGGSAISRREVREFESLDPDLFEEFIVEEIYLEA